MSDKTQNTGGPPADAAALRKRAEEQARTMEPIDLTAQSPEAIQKMLHELRVHQIELETQNEELRAAQEELQASRARYFDLYDLAPVGYCTLSEQGLILEANLTAAALLATASGALIKQPISHFIFRADQDIYYLHRKALFETGEPQHCELRMEKPDGTTFWASLSATAARDAEGAPVCRIAMQDITDRKRTEVELADQKSRYQGIWEESPVSIREEDWSGVITILQRLKNQGVQDYHTYFEQHPEVVSEALLAVKIMDVNEETVRMFHGKDKDDFMHSLETVFATPDTLPGFIGELIALAEGRPTYRKEMRLRGINKELIHVLLTMSFFPKNTKPGTVLVSLIDITERKQAEEALKESVVLLKRSQKIAHLGSWILDVPANRLDWSDEVYRIFGCEPQEFGATYEAFLSFVHPDDRDMVNDAYASSLQEKRDRYEIEHRIVRKATGEVRFVHERCIHEFDAAGAVICSIGMVQDITERKRSEEKIFYMSFHDKLTGLYNRAYMEEEMIRLDTKRQFPLSIIMADLNGLKLINDTYGHIVGDTMLKKVATVLKRSCRSEDILARWGGDEFVLLLPQTAKDEVKILCARIRSHCAKAYYKDLPISIALGSATKYALDKNTEEILKKAEDSMYRQKLSESKSMRSAVINALLKALKEKSFETESHVKTMLEYALKIGSKLNLSESDLRSLSLLVMLHDIGKINIPEKILCKKGPLTKNEWKIIKEHPQTGYRIALATPEFSYLAEDILSHHERWDGLGYPRGLKGSKIPLHARILAVADAYEVMCNGRVYKKPLAKSEVIAELKRCAGKQFDPGIIEKFMGVLT